MRENKQTGQPMVKEEWGDWGPTRSPVGRPAKKDQYGNIIHRKPTSIYLDIRLKEWITDRTGNLSTWIESLIKKAYETEYCFFCFDENVLEGRFGWECQNLHHRKGAGKGMPSTVLKWKVCPNCDTSFSKDNLPNLLPKDVDGCDQCKKEELLI